MGRYPRPSRLLAEFSRDFKIKSGAASSTGRHLSLGATVGVSLTDDFGYEPPFGSPGGPTETVRTGVHDLIAGPMAEFGSATWSVEADAVYRSLRQIVTITSPAAPAFHATETGHTTTWEFPVLAKYKLPLAPAARPFVEVGPSFRIPWSVSNYGITAGAGVQTHFGRLKVSPTLRYTHWQRDNSTVED